MAAVLDEPSNKKKEITVNIPTDAELVIKVPLHEEKNSAWIRLEQPTATNDVRVDVQGSPLIPEMMYYLLPGSTIMLYAWNNASVCVSGSPQLLRNVYRPNIKSITRPLLEYHCMLHAKRTDANKSSSMGPLVLVCGGRNSGKALVARTLVNYAARAGWKPLLVDMDPGSEQMIGPPGSIGAGIVEYPITVDEVISLSLVSTTYFVGSTEAQRLEKNGEASMSVAFVHFVKNLMESVRERLTKHSDDLYGCSGAVLLLPELRDNSGYNYVNDFIQQNGISHVLCVGDDDMFHKLQLRQSQSKNAQLEDVSIDRLSHNFSLVPLPRNEIVLPIKFNDFFLGSAYTVLRPSQWSKPFNSIDVLSIKEENGQVVLSSVPKDELQGVVGCVGAIYQTKVGNALQTAPLVYARVQTIDPAGVYFLTSTHYTFPSEKLTLVVGNIRWITS